MQRAKSIRRWLMVLAWNIVLFAFVVEVSGNLLYWSEHGRTLLFRGASGERGETLREPFTSGDVLPLLHPYFGFVYTERPGATGHGFHINNHYFVQEKGYVERHPGCCDFPILNTRSD